MIGISAGAGAVYNSVRVLSQIGVSAVKAAIHTYAATAGMLTLLYYACEITSACLCLKQQRYYYLYSWNNVFDYVKET